ncbi:hypothetical protein AMS68_002279 [Peltaster fructicola]|uniref:Uncharacterized protein n=1 Tax=Peltaster fructicola TaxID=286661 RepID=A0A6H0XPS1_9PEZI|nr:hypothetical protein AMS68_002279 [Peltaster fructicola]
MDRTSARIVPCVDTSRKASSSISSSTYRCEHIIEISSCEALSDLAVLFNTGYPQIPYYHQLAAQFTSRCQSSAGLSIQSVDLQARHGGQGLRIRS